MARFLAIVFLLLSAGSASAENVRFPSVAVGTSAAGPEITGWLYRPSGAGPFPAIVLAHTCGGVSEHTNVWGKLLASWGYVVVAPDSRRRLLSVLRAAVRPRRRRAAPDPDRGEGRLDSRRQLPKAAGGRFRSARAGRCGLLSQRLSQLRQQGAGPHGHRGGRQEPPPGLRSGSRNRRRSTHQGVLRQVFTVAVILSAAKDLMPVASGDEVLRCAQDDR